MRLAVVGAGYWGKNHVRIALELERSGLLDGVMVCDADPARLRPWEGKAKTTTDLQDVERGADAAVVATPADTHVTIANSLLAAGLHVLVEKPMAIHGGDARAMAALARDRNLVLMPGHIFRYHPAIMALQARMAQGLLGDIRFLATIRTSRTAPRPDVGVLYSLGIHEADLYPYLLGVDYPERAHAETVSLSRPEIDVVASLFLGFRGCSGFALESWIGPGTKDRRLTVLGTKASAEIDYGNLEAMTVFPSGTNDGSSRGNDGAAEIVALSGREPLRTEVEDFLKAVETGGRSPAIADAESGCRAVEIVEALKFTGSFTLPGRT